MRRLLGTATIAAAVSLACATGAGAAVEVGNLCEAKLVTGSEVTAVQLGRESPSGLPATAPTAGVVTSWRVNATFTKEQFGQQLVVLRGSGPSQFAIAGQSDLATVSGGINIFKTRIPVEAGDRFGVAGRALLCETAPAGDVVGTVPGIATTGSSPSFATTTPKRLLSVSASVEPDADGDGYGDETQDLCPISAARQTACPAVTTQAAAIVRRGRVLVIVTSTAPVSVTIGGTVRLPKRAVARLAPVRGTVGPPLIGRLTLKLPRRVRRALAALPRGRSLRMTARVTTTDDIGRVSAANETIKLR